MATTPTTEPGPPRRRRRVLLGGVALASAALGVACGFDPDPDRGVDFAAPGPFTTGSATVQSESGPPVEILYPAADGGGTSEEPAVGAEPSGGGPFPLVVSTDASGDRVRRELSHLASWGLVVAAPARQEADDLADAIDVLTRATIERGGPLEGVIDTEQVALRGRDVLGFAGNPQVDALVITRPRAGAEAAGTGEAPLPPSVLLDVDGPEVADRVDPLYDRLDPPKQLVLVGASAPAADEQRVFDHVSVAHLRSVFGPDREEAVDSLSTEALEARFGEDLAEVRRERCTTSTRGAGSPTPRVGPG
ncbi:MAG: hypothetical protein AAGK32_09200 [Actinomycetota bacterium]